MDERNAPPGGTGYGELPNIGRMERISKDSSRAAAEAAARLPVGGTLNGDQEPFFPIIGHASSIAFRICSAWLSKIMMLERRNFLSPFFEGFVSEIVRYFDLFLASFTSMK
jgi:hypothetical protein